MPDPYKDVERFSPPVAEGLTSGQVSERREQGLTNAYNNVKTKSYAQIFKDNLLTFFNILNIILAALVFWTGHYKDMAFMLLILANLAIGIAQEIASKRTLDKLSLLVASTAIVVRDGLEKRVNESEVVLDDVMILHMGDQIIADAVVADGTLEVNESLITGESDTITKKPGDYLYSGSFVVSGSAYTRVDGVGENSFANRISSGVKRAKKHRSELRSSINAILKIVGVIVVPVGILMFWRQANIDGMGIDDNILRTVAAMIGMIPEGLFLLTSMALATSAIILAYKQTLVQDLYCIETLARVDVLCLDKTGTITEGKMHVADVIPLKHAVDYTQILKELAGTSPDDNSTMHAIRDAYGEEKPEGVVHVIPFSSARKYSGASIKGAGTYILGAYEFVFPDNPDPALKSQNRALAAQGNRVLILAESPEVAQDNELPKDLTPLCFILIRDKIRADAAATLQYFYDQGVELKIISGDNEQTVQKIAQIVGVHGAENAVDATTLKDRRQIADAIEKYDVFGRVTPDQKKEMVLALERAGHTVAMTGDGVNDVLALREADCSVAMASGSEAAKNISTLVLLDSNFAHMPDIVLEGRKVVNNIQRVATLFITKTIYSVLLALFSITILASGYPFSPLQLTLVAFVTIGFPSFFLALEPNKARVKGNFLMNVFQKSLPGGTCVLLGAVFVNVFSAFFRCSAGQISTLCIILTTWIGLLVVIKVSQPFTITRRIIFIASCVIFVLCYTLLGWFFDITDLVWQQWVFAAVMCAVFPLLMFLMEKAVHKLFSALQRHHKLEQMAKRIDEMESETDSDGNPAFPNFKDIQRRLRWRK